MHFYAKHLSLVALLFGCCLLFSGCLRTEITTGQQPSNQTVELMWAHGFAAGLVPPINSPLKVGDQCNNGVAEISFQQTFVQGLAQGITNSIYAPQRFTVTCASGGSMSSAASPPSYLLEESVVETPSTSSTAEAPSTSK